jgi:hypothetical protein
VELNYDSNLAEKAHPSEAGVSRLGGGRNAYLVRVGALSSTDRLWAYGGDFRLLAQTTSREDFHNRNLVSLWPQAWVSWSNLKTWEARLRYDWVSANRWGQRHGPTLSMAHQWNDRIKVQFLYSLLHRGELEDPSNRHEVAMEWSTQLDRENAEPFVALSYVRTLAEGVGGELEKRISVGTRFRLKPDWVATLETGYRWQDFPNQAPATSKGALGAEVRSLWSWAQTADLYLGFDFSQVSSETKSDQYVRWAALAGVAVHP